MGIWAAFYKFKIFSEIMNIYFIAYSVQFSLLMPVLFVMLNIKVKPKFATASIFIAFIVSLFVSVTSSFAIGKGLAGSFMTLTYYDWLALSPTFAVIASFIILILGISLRKKNDRT